MSHRDSQRKRSPRRKWRGPAGRSPEAGPGPPPATGRGGGAGDGKRRAHQPWSRLLMALRAPSSYETIDPNRFVFGQPRLPTWALREPPRAGPTRGGGAGPSDTPRRWTGGLPPGPRAKATAPVAPQHAGTAPPPCVPALWGDSSRAVCPRCPLDTGAKPRHTRRCVPCAEPWPNLTA